MHQISPRAVSRGGRGAVLRCDVVPYVNMPFIRCTKKEPYAIRLALIVPNGLEVADTAQLVKASSTLRFLILMIHSSF